MTNAQDVIINAMAGADLAFVGTVLISLIRSPKLLDDERESYTRRRNQPFRSKPVASRRLKLSRHARLLSNIIMKWLKPQFRSMAMMESQR